MISVNARRIGHGGGGDVWFSTIDGQEWRAYARREQLVRLGYYAGIVGADDPRVVAGLEAWRRGDVYGMGDALRSLGG
jgi:hypothetical protein